MASSANISRAQLEKLRRRYQSVQSRLTRVRENMDEQMGHLMQTTEVSLASFGMGLVNGRFVNEDGSRGVEVLGVPLDLGAGIGLHAAAFLGVSRQYGEHLHNLADGALAAYLTTTGMGVGDRMRKQAAQEGGGGGAASGGYGVSGATDAELNALAHV